MVYALLHPIHVDHAFGAVVSHHICADVVHEEEQRGRTRDEEGAELVVAKLHVPHLLDSRLAMHPEPHGAAHIAVHVHRARGWKQVAGPRAGNPLLDEG